jgi:hypothetical protein
VAGALKMGEYFNEILLSFLVSAFTAWAGVVWWGVKQVLRRIDIIANSVQALDNELSNWITKTESRLARIEEWKTYKK